MSNVMMGLRFCRVVFSGFSSMMLCVFIYLFMIFSWILFYGVIGVLSIFALQFSHINLSLMILIVNSSYSLISGKNGYDFKSVRRWTNQNK